MLKDVWVRLNDDMLCWGMREGLEEGVDLEGVTKIVSLNEEDETMRFIRTIPRPNPTFKIVRFS